MSSNPTDWTKPLHQPWEVSRHMDSPTGVHGYGRAVVTYSTSMTFDSSIADQFVITATDGVAFTINAPTNPSDGRRIIVRIRNTSGGAAGVATWNAVFKMGVWTQPATANSRAIEFQYDGTNWVEISKSAADVPN